MKPLNMAKEWKHATIFVLSSLLALGVRAATWTGANGTDLADPANWSGDVYSTEMQFSGDASLTLGCGTNVFRVFGTSGANRNVTIDLSGHDLGTTADQNSNRDFWRANGTTFMITNSSATAATFAQKSSLCLAYADSMGTRLTVSGEKTVMNGSISYYGGEGCSLDVLNGATLQGTNISLFKNYQTNNVANGATLSASEFVCLGCSGTGKPRDGNTGPWHGNLMSVSDATLSANTLFVACGQKSGVGAPYDNIFRADCGATVTLGYGACIGCGAAATNNQAFVSGSGTTFSAQRLYVGTRPYYDNGYSDGVTATMPATNNAFIAENGAKVSVPYGWVGAGGNSLVVRSGADVAISGVFELSADMTDETIANAGGRIGSRVEIVGGTLGISNRIDVCGYGYPHEVFVGEGGRFGNGSICFHGSGARLVVSNGTAKVKYLQMRYGGSEGSNNIVRIIGERAYVETASPTFADAAATFEFVIPEGGWSAAPFKSSSQPFTLPADFTVRFDKASVKAYKNHLMSQGLSRGTVPLMETASWHGITVDDMSALSANLPDGCSLKNENGVLSVEVKTQKGLIIYCR